MSHYIHDAIVVTHANARSQIVEARDKALDLGLVCTELVESKINGFLSFMIAPDGSYENRDMSDEEDDRRERWKAWAIAQWKLCAETLCERGMFLRWVHVRFGEIEEDGDDDYAEAGVMRWWWLSFADTRRPRGSQWLGMCVVQAHDLVAAIRVAWAQGLNPGGQVMSQDFDAVPAPPPAMLGRLITDRAELERLAIEWHGVGTETNGEAKERERS